MRDYDVDAPQIPGSTRGLSVAGARAFADLSATLREVTDDGARDVAFTVVARAGMLDLDIDGELTPGSRLVFEGELRDSYTSLSEAAPQQICTNPVRGEFLVGEPTPLPTTLGNLDVTYDIGEAQVGSSPGCWERPLASRAHLELVLDAVAEPWQTQLIYETFVDGVRWDPEVTIGYVTAPDARPSEYGPRFVPGGSQIAQARGVDVLYAVCDSSAPEQGASLAEGAHEVQMRARVPGSEAWIESDTVTVTLPPCSTEDAEGSSDAAPEDVVDTAQPEDASEPKRSGGSCALGHPTRSGFATGSWLVLAALGSARLRRRRR